MPPLSAPRSAPFLLSMWCIFVLYCAAIRLPQQIDQVNQEPVKKQYGCSKHRHFSVTGSLDIFIFIATFKKQIISGGFVFFHSVCSPVALGEAIYFSERYCPLHPGPGPFCMVVTSFITMSCNVADSAEEMYALEEHFEKKLIQSFRMNYYLYIS